jgi:hypothetical protein
MIFHIDNRKTTEKAGSHELDKVFSWGDGSRVAKHGRVGQRALLYAHLHLLLKTLLYIYKGSVLFA